jgi:hypothetical protein
MLRRAMIVYTPHRHRKPYARPERTAQRGSTGSRGGARLTSAPPSGPVGGGKPAAPYPGRAAMASGFGVKGNKGRCYAFWMDFSKCMSEADHPTSCAALREDYLECLHHRKEARRRPAPPADGLRNPDFSARRALPPPLAPRLPLARALAAQRSLAPALPSALGTLRRPVLPGFARTSCLACALTLPLRRSSTASTRLCASRPRCAPP